MQGGPAVQFYCHPTITAAEARAAAAGFGQLLIKHHHLLQKPSPSVLCACLQQHYCTFPRQSAKFSIKIMQLFGYIECKKNKKQMGMCHVI